ncbi:DUF948 domain-containing protein [Cryobacterium sp. TMT2-4]|uniref:DUF948 domain-containing protein n=1 Tax=Cryobacterium sp. TMT2-4 TaxID=1259254 RepID=UPI00106B2E97|nr:DUF948 domain-containing protein [Cryobacterium sp. TMT2-4]TFC70778.1 DUF948 domain-containing protein [Cryobacterium sp. TMT2-4]
MSGGDIVGLVFAAAFLMLVGFLALPLVKLGRVFDETTVAIRDLTHTVTPLLEESTKTIQETNAQLARVDTITSNVADVTGNVSALVALVASTVGGPLVKLAGFSAGVRAALGAARPGGTRRRRHR